MIILGYNASFSSSTELNREICWVLRGLVRTDQEGEKRGWKQSSLMLAQTQYGDHRSWRTRQPERPWWLAVWPNSNWTAALSAKVFSGLEACFLPSSSHWHSSH